MTAGAIVLVGHFQTALYAFFALAIFLAADFLIDRDSVRGSAVALLVAVAAGAALSAVMVLPGLGLTRQSVRAGADYSKDAGSSLVPGALATLINPNHYGALDPDHYTGPTTSRSITSTWDPDDSPALLGLAAARERWYGLALFVASAWYATGPAGGLYSVVAMLPGFRNLRAPVHM